MRRSAASLVGLLAFGVPLSAAWQEAGSREQLVFRSAATELVVLPVTVTNGDGRFVSGLPAERFTVFDNGQRQPIQFFTSEDIPVSIALVLDNSGSMRTRKGEVIAAASSFARWSHPDDELFVVAFNDYPRDALAGRSLTADDHDELEAALGALRPEGQTALYDGLLAGLDRLERARHARKILVLLSDGGDNASRRTADEVVTRMRRANATVYTIGLFGRNSHDANPGLLKRLASVTGGERFLPRSPGPLLQACERIAREIRSGYTVGFAPPQHDGNYHRVHVELTGADAKDMKVRTRPGYFAAGSPVPQTR